MISKSHYFFLLDLSPWPLIASLNAFSSFLSLLSFLKFGEVFGLLVSLFSTTIICLIWWSMYSSEFLLEGKGSANLENGVKLAMLLFISSEVFFFFSFFWSYFHFYLSPMANLGLSWPPQHIESFDFTNVPLINTFVLLTSGATVTISHNFLIIKKKSWSIMFLSLTVILGCIFTCLQVMEYNSSFFGLSDSTFGSSFFMLTGFHGIHVLIGTIFLLVSMVRMQKMSSSGGEATSFEMASWYWHFVDVVWIFLYFSLYYLNA